MKLSQIKKKYPKAWAEFIKKNSGCATINQQTKYKGYLHKIEIRRWFTPIVDHFDRLGIKLSIIHYECDLSDFKGQWALQITDKSTALVCYENRKTRRIAESAGLAKLFETREKQLKLKS